VGRVTIYEDPSIGIEPVVYIEPPYGSMEVAPSIWSLLGGRFEIASIRLDDASINLTKSGPASEWGAGISLRSSTGRPCGFSPAIRGAQQPIHFKFGDTKSVFYLTETDLDISPTGASGDWKIACSARPARTDRPAQGLGSFSLKGRWYTAPEPAGPGSLCGSRQSRRGHGAAPRAGGRDPRQHHVAAALAGPLNNIGITGRLDIGDVHRWDLMPNQGQGWPLDIRGRLDLMAQQLELHSNTAGSTTLPLSVHFRATGYLSQPHWAVAVNWNRFPPRRCLSWRCTWERRCRQTSAQRRHGWGDRLFGAGQFQGQLAFHDAALTIRDSPPVRFEQAQLSSITGTRVFRRGGAQRRGGRGAHRSRLRDGPGNAGPGDFSDAMKVQSLRAQVALAAVPFLEQIASGQWSGRAALQPRRVQSRLERTALLLTDAQTGRAGAGRSAAVDLRARANRWRGARGGAGSDPSSRRGRSHSRASIANEPGAPRPAPRAVARPKN